MANFTGSVIGVNKTAVKELNGLQPTSAYSLEKINGKPYLPGFAWETQTCPAGSWRAITYGAGKFVAVSSDVGSTSSVMTSTDGLTWTAQITPAGKAWNDITYGGGQFVAVGILGSPATQRIMTSPDGITWTLQTHTTCQLTSVAYGNGVYVAVSQSATPKILISADGITWSDYNPANLTASLIGRVRFFNGTFICCPSTPSANIAYSVDGITWTIANTTASGSWIGISLNTTGIFQYMLTSNSNTNKVYSNSGISGPYSIASSSLSRLSYLMYSDISGVYVGSDSRSSLPFGLQRISTSSNGGTWTVRSGIPTINIIQSIAYGDNRLVAIGTDYVGVSY